MARAICRMIDAKTQGNVAQGCWDGKNATESIPRGAQNSARSGGVREEGGVDGRPRLKFPAVGPDYGAKG